MHACVVPCIFNILLTMMEFLDESFKQFEPVMSCLSLAIYIAILKIFSQSRFYPKKKKVKEADLYSAFIEVPYTQGAPVRITQCYLQTTPYLPLPRKHSPDGASQTEVADI